MDSATQVIIGVAVVGLGVATVVVGLVAGEESEFRYVEDVVGAPARHASGTFTLIGTPLMPNATTATRVVTLWEDAGAQRQSEVVVTLSGPDASGVTTFAAENRTRAPGARAAEPTTTGASWTVSGPHVAFLVRGFPHEGAPAEDVWALYRDLPPEPLPPKPSQFTGRLATSAPDGTPLPPGVLLFEVDTYKIGCSSKFLPPEAQEAMDPA